MSKSVFQWLDEVIAPDGLTENGGNVRTLDNSSGEESDTLALVLERAGLAPRAPKTGDRRRLGLLCAAALLVLGAVSAVAASGGVTGLFRGVFQEQRGERVVELSAENLTLEKTAQRLDLTQENGNLRVTLTALAGDADRGTLMLEAATLDGSPLGEGPLGFEELEGRTKDGILRTGSNPYEVEEQSRPAPDRAVMKLNLYGDLGPGERVELTLRNLVRREYSPQGEETAVTLAEGEWKFSFPVELPDLQVETAPGAEAKMWQSTVQVEKVVITPYQMEVEMRITGGALKEYDKETFRRVLRETPYEERLAQLTLADGSVIQLLQMGGGWGGSDGRNANAKFLPLHEVLIPVDEAVALDCWGAHIPLE